MRVDIYPDGIYPDGKVHSVQSTSGPAALSEAAQQAVLQYPYTPFREKGKFVNVSTHIDVPFVLPPGAARTYIAPNLKISGFSEISNDLTHPLSDQMQQRLKDDLANELNNCRAAGDEEDKFSAEQIREAMGLREIPGAQPLSAYLVSRRASCQCGAQGSNCPLKLVQDTPQGVRVIPDEVGWGVVFVPRDHSSSPDVFFAQHMSAFEAAIFGFANIAGEWGQLYCGTIRINDDQQERQRIRECR